jgi:hypothetical protein
MILEIGKLVANNSVEAGLVSGDMLNNNAVLSWLMIADQL